MAFEITSEQADTIQTASGCDYIVVPQALLGPRQPRYNPDRFRLRLYQPFR